MTVIAVTGLRAEARLAGEAGLTAICAGGDPKRTAALLHRSLSAGTTGLISLGIAGGLAPSLPPGTLLVARGVLADGGIRYAVDAAWSRAVHARTGGIEDDIVGAEHIVATTDEKRALRDLTGAAAVDLESLVVARTALGADLPFIVIRVISDPAERELPSAARIPLSGDGAPNLTAVARAVLVRPREIGGLIRTALDARCALRALRRGLAAAGTVLSCSELSTARPGSPRGL